MPRHYLNMAQPLEGHLLLADAYDGRLNRYTRQARFLSLTDLSADLVPRLGDAQLIYAGQAAIVLNGSELIDERDYLQTWMLALQRDRVYALTPSQAVNRGDSGRH